MKGVRMQLELNKVNPGSTQAYDRGPSDNTCDSDNSNSFWCDSKIILSLQMIEVEIFC